MSLITRRASAHVIDGEPERGPWIDLSDLKRRGAVVVWDVGDLHTLPAQFRNIAQGAVVQPPLQLHYLHGDSSLDVGWAILPGGK